MQKHRAQRARGAARVALLALALASAPGCLWAPELAGIKRDIERQLPGADFDREFALSLGPVTLGLARVVTAVFPGTGEARGYLRDVSRVQVAVYKTHSLPPHHLRAHARAHDEHGRRRMGSRRAGAGG